MSMDGSTTGKRPWVLRTFLVHLVVSALAMTPFAAVTEGRWSTELALGVGMFAGGVIGGAASFVYGRRRGGGTVGVAIVSVIYPLMGLIMIIMEAA